MRETLLLLGLGLMISCGNPPERRAVSAEQLAKAQCSTCHVYPGPELLPKKEWSNVLPHMGLRLGIEAADIDPFAQMKLDEIHRITYEGVFPEEPVITDSLWAKIENFFISNAPDSFDLPERNYPESTRIFKTTFPEISIGGSPFISMTKFDKNGILYLADWSGHLIQLNSSLEINQFTNFPRPVVDINTISDETLLALSIGDLYPNDRTIGAVARTNPSTLSTPELLFSDLPRPVHFDVGDIDNDGLEDLLICNFGNYVGDLSWYKNAGTGYEAQLIKNAPGATRSFLLDLDNDQDLDIIALFAQGDEGISLFYNEGGVFEEKRILRFHPLFGSNDIEILDMDGDNDLDIVLSNGDNGDHSITLKPYHGIHIYLNDGAFNFSETYFFPMYGASKVRASDFDQDGDMDLIAASFFPENGEGLKRSIIYLDNTGDFNFEPYRIAGADKGRWMVMDSGDFDQDGDTDVVIGSFTLTNEGIDKEVLTEWRKSKNYIMVLENQTARH
ncbi:FG-GAP repeat domain-containing protein [Fulvivirga sedimenti]|uniref:VCBS repeat-containing protein n=1 Tax=Fulvivirga sedimenti TaxID=2879465 RepID=A0A9X1L357_9BACT|nr:VCBS repeat-containing protein [Fulvivirga sedimenti]MCA6078916.1 VCBS repeat-containing protein [Fulvivirga sedimenti]